MKKIFEHIKTFSMNLKEKFQGIIMFVSKIIFISCIVIILIRQFKNQIKSLLVFMGFNEIYLNKITKQRIYKSNERYSDYPIHLYCFL